MSDKNSSVLSAEFKQLLEKTDEIFFSYNATENVFLYLNKAFENVWELPCGNVYANSSLLLQKIFEEDKEYLLQAYTNPQWEGTLHITEFRIVMDNGEVKWIRLRACTYQNKSVRIITGSALDFSTERSYTDKLHKFATKKNSILEILSHDLVSPLNNIKLATSLLDKEADFAGRQNISELLTMITRNSGKALELIKDFLKEEFIESIEVDIFKQRGDIVEKIREVYLQYQKVEKDIRKTFYFITPADSLFLSFDDSKFMQVINNLVSNAVKFTRDDGIITIRLEDKADTVLLQVEDNGVGIPADVQPYLFDRFTKAKRQGLKGEPSVGLGMSIIKTIVEWHGGKIWFETEEGKGSIFYVELPKM